MSDNIFFKIWFRFYKLALVIIFVAGFFSFYNMFLIDQTLEGLRYSLEQTVVAYDIEDVNGLDMLITRAIAKEIPPHGVPSRAGLIHLEFANDIVSTGKSFKQLGHMKVALDTAIKEKEKQRGTFLTIMDKINKPLREGIVKLAFLARSFFAPKTLLEEPSEIDIDLFEQFRALEEGKDLKELITNYTNFINAYPEYEKISLAKLRLAYTYQRLGKYDIAIDMYSEIEKKYASKKEAKIAQVFLVTLKKKSVLLKKINAMLVESRKVSPENIDEKQKIFYNVGLIYMELFNLKEATKFFRRAISLKPSSHVATSSKYSMAWLARQQKDYETSSAIFSQIISEKPGDNLVFDSFYQISSLYHRQGKYKEFVELSLKLADDYKAYPIIASLCLFQAGASYMYDLNDPEKANEIFARLLKEYPGTAYAKYLAPASPTGVFVTYLVPRATRVVAWRILGLVCLSGYTGEVMQFSAVSNEAGFNLGFNNWLRQELPDTVGNVYVDIRGHETEFTKDRAKSKAKITMGQFNVYGRGEWALGVTEGKTLDFIVKKAFLEKVPIPPILLNNSLVGIKRVVEKNFPVEVAEARVESGKIIVEGIGSKAALHRLKKDTETLFLADFKIKEIESAAEREKAYALFAKKFPEGDFSINPKRDRDSLFLDFFTRITLYTTFKMLETVKDSKLDFERSIRTLGRLMLKEDRFRVDFKEDKVNSDLSRYIKYEFPWLIDNEFYVDIRGLEVQFTGDGNVLIDGNIGLGYGTSPKDLMPEDIHVEGKMIFVIDPESGIPRWEFKELSLNSEPFPSLDKINLLTSRCFNMLKDENLPITMEHVVTYKGGIIFKGKGAGDYISRLFYDPYPFVIFQIRKVDLKMAGVQRIKPAGKGDEGLKYRGRTLQQITPEEKRRFVE